MRAIFQRKSKKRAKNGKIFKKLGQKVQNLKIEKGQVIVCDYRTQ